MKYHFKQLINQHLTILKSLQYRSGLFGASAKSVGTGYDKAWLRDNFYECLAFESVGDFETVKKTYKALLDIFKKHEYKIDWAIQKKPEHKHEYIHARYNPENFDEFWEDWGNKQNDAVGAILFKLGELEHKGINVLITKDDIRITQKLVYYLESIEYWHEKDSGIWEENEEIHSSSLGACVAGLKMISGVKGIEVPIDLILKGEKALNNLLPRESEKKYVDLALLSLIWPYDVVSKKQKDLILSNVEYHLEKEKGVIRYKNDHYYNNNPDGYSEEAEWTFGLSWLAIIYEKLGNLEMAEHYVEKAKGTLNKNNEVPELYFSHSSKYNENSPLGWSESLFIVALYELNKKYFKK